MVYFIFYNGVQNCPLPNRVCGPHSQTNLFLLSPSTVMYFHRVSILSHTSFILDISILYIFSLYPQKRGGWRLCLPMPQKRIIFLTPKFLQWCPCRQSLSPCVTCSRRNKASFLCIWVFLSVCNWNIMSFMQINLFLRERKIDTLNLCFKSFDVHLIFW